VPEFQAGLLGALGVALAPGEIQGMQRGACCGVGRGGDRVQ
jgi:hypothetical protein